MTVRVALEEGSKRSFASALDWPGWSRGARTPDDALGALLAYAPRYAAVARRAKIAFTPPKMIRDLDVVHRLPGSGSTDFGIPASATPSDDAALSSPELTRQLDLLRAAWATFDEIAADAKGVTLTVGPRGGGRQVAKIVDHVRDAEISYLTQLGSKPPARDAVSAGVRDAFVETLTARAEGTPLANPNRVRKLWSPRYAFRRTAWHALDHAWEIEDRSIPR